MRHKILNISFLLLIFISLFSTSVFAQQRHAEYPFQTQWQTYSTQAKEGQEPALVAVLWVEPDTGWYTYTQSPGGFAKPTRIEATLSNPAGKPQPLATIYPPGTTKQDALDPGSMVNVYEGRTPILFALPQGTPLPARITAHLDLLLCTKDKCLPTNLELSTDIISKTVLPGAEKQTWWPLVPAAAKAATAEQGPGAIAGSSGGPASSAMSGTPGAPAQADWSNLKPRYNQPELEVQGLLKAVLLGVLAGFILNFMPCVLPVISIKLSALMAGSTEADQAQRKARFREHNIFFALGALLYFLALSIVLGLTGLAWGQIFQKPEVVLVLTTLIFALSLSLFGVFSLPIVDLKFDQMTTHPKLQAMFTGMLATLLATPCSGPFLGGVLGWTLLQPPWVISTVLLSIGSGMALPYLLMAAFPGLVRLFPKPGAWTGSLEKIVGLFLLGTCVYLLSILPESKLISALALLWFTAVGAWIYGEAGPGFEWPKTLLLKTLALGFIVAGALLVTTVQHKAHWEPFTPATLTSANAERMVIVDFTADWCPSCKVLEQTTLSPGHMAELKARYDVTLLKADMTEDNPEATALLTALGSNSIPVLAIFPKGEMNSPAVLRDLFTQTQLEDALKQATRK